jgi:hypothetical protein
VRRSMHSLIVALLCLTLFVDSAKACWWLRQHRSRGHVCRPVCPPPCALVPGEPVAHEVIFVDDQSDCLCDAAPAEQFVSEEHVVLEDHVVLEQTIGHDDVEHGVEDAAVAPTGRVEDSVVVHGPTMVVDATPAQPAISAAEPSSVVAQPMPVAAAGGAVLPTPTIAQEPIPALKPAIEPQSPVSPASNEQPMPEPQAAAAAMAKPTAPVQAAEATAGNDAADDAAAPMPAPAEDLAGGPTMKLPMQPPKEPNLFDLYDNEGDDDVAAPEDMPSEEAPVDSKPATADDDAGEPAEDSAAEATATDDPEMTDDDAKATEAEATDGGSETAKPDAAAEEPAADDAAEEPDAAPEAAAEQAEADPAEAALAVPNEPMRSWSNDTGTHHTQGWLVEVRTDRVRILKVNGRHTTVLTESLSAADRDYVQAVGDRLATQQQGTSPAPSTTAGL